MKTRRLTILLVAGVLAAAGFTAFSTAASAQSETVTVRLPSGEVVRVTVDVPPGGSLEDAYLEAVGAAPAQPPDEAVRAA